MSAVIVDTNILVRAFLSGKLADDKILRLIIRGQHQLVYGRRQLEEFTRVLGYRRITKKYFIDKKTLAEFLLWIGENGKEIEAEEVNLCRDPDDNQILGLAVAAARGKVVYLITGDRDILVLKEKIKGVQILTAGEFVVMLKD